MINPTIKGEAHGYEGGAALRQGSQPDLAG